MLKPNDVVRQPHDGGMMEESHKWQNIDKHGTIGWHRCSECGIRSHFTNNEPNNPPWMAKCCDRLTKQVAILADNVTKLLHDSDADTDTIRSLLAAAITQQKVDSPYTRAS